MRASAPEPRARKRAVFAAVTVTTVANGTRGRAKMRGGARGLSSGRCRFAGPPYSGAVVARPRRRLRGPSPPLLSPAPTRLALLRPNKRMLRRPLLLARERAFPLSKIGGRLPRRPKRHAKTMQRRQRSTHAPRHPPSRSRRHQLRADLLLRLARNPGFRLQLNENSSPTIDDHRVGKPAPHAPPLLQQPVQTRRRLVLEARPKHGLRIEIPRQQPSQCRLRRPLLAAVSTPGLGGLAHAAPPPSPGPSYDGAVGVACGITPAMSTIAFAAIIRVCSPASVSFPNAIAANSFVASGKYLRARALVCATPSAGSSVDGMGQ